MADGTVSVQDDGAGPSEPSSSTPATRKQVQVVGAPPPFYGTKTNGKSKEEGEESDVDEEEEEDDTGEQQQDEDGEEEIDDADLLSAFEEDTDVIDLTHLRLSSKSLRKMPLQKFIKLQRLVLRQNEISKFTEKDIGSLHELQELDMYDNSLEKTYGEVLKGCPNLETLDLSFNAIRHISHLSHLSKLHTLYLVQNKIAKVRPDDLAAPLGLTLKSLELGSNRLRSLENIGHLTQLEELWVGKNKITKLEGLNDLVNLRILSIQSNRITKLENLDKLHNLEELYLSHNGLERIEGLENNIKLTTLENSNASGKTFANAFCNVINSKVPDESTSFS